MGKESYGSHHRLAGPEKSTRRQSHWNYACADVLGLLMLSTDMFDLATANWFSGEALPSTLVGPWNGIVELGYTMGLVGCVAALTRRIVFTPEN